MNLSKVTCFLLLLILVTPGIMMGQGDRLIYTQSVVKHEYLNPAYNSFRDYTSLSLFARDQWHGVEGNPRALAASFHAPVKVAGFGAGMLFLAEDIGLRNKLRASARACQNVRIGKTRYLALGLGIGIENDAYDTDEMNPPDESGYYVPSGDELDYWALNTTVGLMYYGKYLFAGISSEFIFNKEQNADRKLLPGYSLVLGGSFKITDDILFRPDMEFKYYPDVDDYYNDDAAYYDPIYDLSLNFMLYDKFWLGVERRFGMAQIFSVDFLLITQLQIGYSYELGVGDGVNKFDSHCIRLAYNFKPKNARRSFSTKERRKINKTFNFPYR